MKKRQKISISVERMNEADNQAETAVSVNYEIPDKSEPGQSDPGTEYPSVGGKQLELFQEKLLAPESRSRHKLIGQLFDTYWLVEFENQFYIIDQHAAHEKVNYERFVKRFKEQSIESQYLNPPLVVTLNMDEQAKLKANEEYFRKYGFEIEPLVEGNTVSVQFRQICTDSMKKNSFWKCLTIWEEKVQRMLLTFSQQDLPQWHANLLSKEIIRCLLWRQIS